MLPVKDGPGLPCTMIVAGKGPKPVTVTGGLGTTMIVGKPCPVKDGAETAVGATVGAVPVRTCGGRGWMTIGNCPWPVNDGVGVA